MFKKEAEAIGAWLDELPAEQLQPVLNIGSADVGAHAVSKPWIDGSVYRPLKERGIKTLHCDIRRSPGVDIVGDLLNDEDHERIKGVRPGLVLLCNVLEHVVDPITFIERAGALLAPGHLLLVTGPRSYPEHHCPIDNGLRPTPEEFGAMGTGMTMVKGKILPTEYHWHEIARNPRKLMGRKLKWLFTPYLVSMALLQRQ